MPYQNKLTTKLAILKTIQRQAIRFYFPKINGKEKEEMHQEPTNNDKNNRMQGT